jgi:hypothetical protein
MPRPGFVCIHNATLRVEEALAAAAGVRGQEGVKEEEVRADIVALCLKPNHAIISKIRKIFVFFTSKYPAKP